MTDAPKIARIEMTPLLFEMAPDRAYGMARGLNFRRSCALIEVETDAGVIGYGEAGAPLGVVREYLNIVRPFFAGQSVYDFEIVAAGLYNRLYHFGAQSAMTACLSGISIALIDAIGKTLDVSAHDLLGGKTAAKLPCYATTGYLTPENGETLEAQLDGIAGGGFAGVKIKIGVDPASDVERVRIARRVLGDDMALMVDINGNYTPDIALETLKRIEPFDIHWCEEPVPPTDTRGYAELRARSPIPIAGGEAFYTVHDFKRVIEARGLDVAMPAVISCGGFGEAKAIARLAAMHNVRVSPSVWGNAVAIAASLHFAASLPTSPHTDNVPYPLLIEYDTGENPLRDRLLKTPLARDADGLTVPSGPGLGIELDLDAVKDLIVD